MTTIAYKDGVMAADSGCWHGDVVTNGSVKIAHGKSGRLYGLSGAAAECSGFVRWVNEGEVGDYPVPAETGPSEGKSAFLVLMVWPSGALQIIGAYGVEDLGDVPFMAMGSGAPTAMGALAVGATPQQAIKAVIDYGTGAIGPVRYVSKDDPVVRTFA